MEDHSGRLRGRKLYGLLQFPGLRATSDRDESYVGAMVPQAAAVSEDFLGEIGSLLAEYPPLHNDPGRATAVAAALLSAVQQRDTPPGLAAGLAATVAGLSADRAVPLLLRIAELGCPPAAVAARSELQRLRLSERGDHPPLELIEAWRVDTPEAEALALDLGRGGDVEARAFLVLDRRHDPAGVLAGGCAGPPVTGEPLMELLSDFDDGATPEPVSGDAVSQRIRAGCKTAVADGQPIPAELAVALTLLAAPVLGDAAAVPALEVDPTDVLYGDPDAALAVDVLKDEDAACATIDALLLDYKQHLATRRRGGARVDADTCLFIADAMLSYKANYSDGLLGDWTLAELGEFMLEWWPRKVVGDAETDLHAPAAVVRFLRFLDDRGSLSGNSPEQLADAITDLLEEFTDACLDRDHWGPAKSLVLAATQEGVDIRDRDALETYLTQLAPRLPDEPVRPQGSSRDARRARRKSARTARRRNRR